MRVGRSARTKAATTSRSSSTTRASTRRSTPTSSTAKEPRPPASSGPVPIAARATDERQRHRPPGAIQAGFSCTAQCTRTKSTELSKGSAEAVEFPRLCCKSLFVYLRSPHMTKRDPVVADIAPSADTLTAYDNYPFSQHVSYIVDPVQHLDSFHFSAKRRNETDSAPACPRSSVVEEQS